MYRSASHDSNPPRHSFRNKPYLFRPGPDDRIFNQYECPVWEDLQYAMTAFSLWHLKGFSKDKYRGRINAGKPGILYSPYSLVVCSGTGWGHPGSRCCCTTNGFSNSRKMAAQGNGSAGPLRVRPFGVLVQRSWVRNMRHSDRNILNAD
jgi:hypothetical protein